MALCVLKALLMELKGLKALLKGAHTLRDPVHVLVHAVAASVLGPWAPGPCFVLITLVLGVLASGNGSLFLERFSSLVTMPNRARMNEVTPHIRGL